MFTCWPFNCFALTHLWEAQPNYELKNKGHNENHSRELLRYFKLYCKVQVGKDTVEICYFFLHVLMASLAKHMDRLCLNRYNSVSVAFL